MRNDTVVRASTGLGARLRRPLVAMLWLGLALAMGGATRALGAEYYVATTGDDTAAGTSDAAPLATIAKAVELAAAGDTIWVHGGVYPHAKTLILNKSGAEGQPIRLWAIPGELPRLDFASVDNYGVQVDAAWWHLKGLSVENAGAIGVQIWGLPTHHNIFENLVATGNQDTGINLCCGAGDNLVLNCDSYANYDPKNHGEHADGFGAKFGVEPGNRVIGCRAWNNSDDGFDCWDARESVYFEQCYSWDNGSNMWGDTNPQGDGNGFKLGISAGVHELVRCASWDEPGYGYDLNGNTSGVRLFNSTAMSCKVSYRFDYAGANIDKNLLRNNLAYNSPVQIDPRVDDDHNSWNTPGVSISAADFQSVQSAELEGPRQPSGALPMAAFMRLSPTSEAIDAGVEVGLPFNGAAPDLGAFETPEVNAVDVGDAWLRVE